MLVGPSLPSDNNGNGRTMARWARLLRSHCRIRTGLQWDGSDCDVLVALHARRSAASVAAFRSARPDRPVVLVLTGTDLYGDIALDADARHSLALADHLVVLQPRGVLALPRALRARCHVIFQSAPALAPARLSSRVLRVLWVGHLREVKQPQTLLRAAGRLAHRRDIRFELIGASLDPALADAVRATQASCPNFHWLGALSHAATRQRMRRAHVLVNTSSAEGGAHVVLEAVRSGGAVLASRIDGNIGMLGDDYDGYFTPGDDAALAACIERARDEPGWLARLRAQCAARAPCFDPLEEQRRLRALIDVAWRGRDDVQS